tara:strand:- start:98 stop:799 length:702 start_codon:yes stop_codon:yes gene_type:complete
MVSELLNLWLSFLAGLSAPLLAVCVIPLYPGFLSYLASQFSNNQNLNLPQELIEKEQKKKIILFGIVTTLGVITSMAIFGLIFVKILQESLTKAIGVISPIAFVILAIVSILLILNLDFTRFFPRVNSPRLKNPYLSSFGFGFFFGAIVLPCNPAALITLFAISTSTISAITNFFNFTLFGIGMAAPLLIFAIISSTRSQEVITFLTNNKKIINRIAGVIMLSISLYYLIFVF